MIKKTLSCLMLSLILGLTACATGGSVGDYAPGSDSAAIKAGRNQATAQMSRAELEQHRRQRANVAEEMDLEDKKRTIKRRELNSNLGTAAAALGTVGAIVSIFK